MKRSTFVVLIVVISGCATITLDRPPVLSPFGDGTQWVVLENMDFIIQLDHNSTTMIRVPRGFVTDLASTPRVIWSYYPPFGKYLTASILHDYLYWRQVCNREQADKILYQTMRDAGVDQETQSRFYVALNLDGKKAWDTNTAESAQRLIRVIPEEKLKARQLAQNPVVNWTSYRMELAKQNVHETPPTSDASLPRVCAALGNEIKAKTDLMAIVLGK